MALVDASSLAQLGASNVFKTNYGSYQGLYAGDYIGHRAAYEAIKPFLQGKHGSFDLLDLGCGDAWAICKALGELDLGGSLRSYAGVDMSAPAIETAKDNLARLSTGCQLHWHVTDMLSYLRRSDAQEADFIIASFSMHHLTTADKLAVLREGRRLLAPRGGSFFMVDVLRREQESVQEYRDRICGFAAREWVLVDPEGRQKMIDHMQEYDMPDAKADFDCMAREAGYSRVQHACLSDNGYGNLLVFDC